MLGDSSRSSFQGVVREGAGADVGSPAGVGGGLLSWELHGQRGSLPDLVWITAKAGSSLGNVSLTRWEAHPCSPSVGEGSHKCHLASCREMASGRQRAPLWGRCLIGSNHDLFSSNRHLQPGASAVLGPSPGLILGAHTCLFG